MLLLTHGSLTCNTIFCSKITPEVHRANLESMTVRERGCLMSGENGLISSFRVFMNDTDAVPGTTMPAKERRSSQLLEAYSPSGCYYECMLQFAAYKCGCLPWVFPQYTTFNKRQRPRNYYNSFEHSKDAKHKGKEANKHK